MAKRDYYDVLGIDRSAGEAQIKAAYRKLARKYHPDVNKAKDAPEKFREATEAYEVLSDAKNRKLYDQFGHAGPKGSPFGRGGARGQSGRVDFDIGDIFGRGTSGFSGMGLDDILSMLGGAGRRRRPARARGSDVEYELKLSFADAVAGTTASLRYLQPGTSGQPQTIEVKIPAGVRNGSKVRLRGRGAVGPGGPGDLYIKMLVEEHPYFRREQDDIYIDLPVSIVEAALGAKVDVPTLDGTKTVKIPTGTPGGRKLRLKGKGVAKAGQNPGDLYVVVKIVPPKSVSKSGRELLEKFADAEQFDARAKAPWN